MKKTDLINPALSEVVAFHKKLWLPLSQTIKLPFAHFLIYHEGDRAWSCHLTR